MTQAKLAKYLSLGESTISFYESGKRTPDFDLLRKIAAYFNVTTDYLLGITDYPNLKAIEELYPSSLKDIELDYLYLAMKIQEENIPPSDIYTIIEIMKRNKSSWNYINFNCFLFAPNISFYSLDKNLLNTIESVIEVKLHIYRQTSS